MVAKDEITGMGGQETGRVRKKLLAWYEENRRDLPWRKTSDPYRILVSEVMLQQTQVRTVIPYYEKFLARFPSAGDLAGAGLQEVLKLWEGLGYYARARNLHRAAKIIVAEHGGRVPGEATTIRKLPGVGDYIAAAVLSIAFGRPLAVVDGNVKRVLSRMLCMEYPVNAAASHRHFQAAAATLLAQEDPGAFNQAMMELGALVCRPDGPECSRCPVADTCCAFAVGKTGEYPKREKRKPLPVHRVAVGVVRRNGRMLITRRKPDGLLGGLWEFPGGKILPEETPEAACIREIKEETNLSVEVTGRISRVKHAYTHFKIEMEVFSCRYLAGRVKLSDATGHRWITLEELDTYPFPKANHKFFKALSE